jgi:hypothetical protein
MPIAECGLKKKSQKSEIRNPKSEITGPMLFPRNALVSGPQACFYPGINQGARIHSGLTYAKE